MKLQLAYASTIHKCVASRAEAWVETAIIRDVPFTLPVASRAEAWVETLSSLCVATLRETSPPARRRGLKQLAQELCNLEFGRRLPRGGVG